MNARRESLVLLIIAGFAFQAGILWPMSAGAEEDHESVVTVLVDGKPAENMVVNLIFQDTTRMDFRGRAVSFPYRTDASGTARVKHSAVGPVHVMVMDEWECHRTGGDAPGLFIVRLSSSVEKHKSLLAKWNRPKRDNSQGQIRTSEPKRDDSVQVCGPRSPAANTERSGLVLTNQSPTAATNFMAE